MEANTFELSGENLRVTYAAQGNAGQPVLTYEDPDSDKTFQKDEIRILNTEIRQLVTVTLQMGVDQGTRMLTLLLPTVTVAQARAPVAIKAKAILTTFPNSVGPNLPGPAETYRVESLHGSAEFILVQTTTQPGAQAQVA